AAFRRAGCSEAEGHVNLAYVLTLEKHLAEARQHYERALACDASSAAAQKGLQELDAVGIQRVSAEVKADGRGNDQSPGRAWLALTRRLRPSIATAFISIERSAAAMAIALITGSAGLIGGEAVRFFSRQGHTVVGIDNDMRRYFFGAEASTDWSRRQLQAT